ncbi:hypothetical protein GH714_038167 [Hevea brasiliensis]|uniref:DUF569 domain-containing protein n=1 Tax=Hevea brasiliensis TaxID=3981 RepID=A0A6A6LEX9_HEVBR|nr:hypothetical protein GH714_038167 [Hevea brasiliensis]
MAVKLRSHLDKYMIADDDGETVRQSKNGSSRKARWLVELVEGRTDAVRLKTCDGRYLTASDLPFLLGMTGKRVIQTLPEKITDLNLEWEPIRDGFQVKLKSWCGKFLRGNGESVEAVETETLAEYLSSMSSFSSVPEDVLEAASDEYLGSEPGSPISVVSSRRTPRLTVIKSMSPRLSPKKSISNHFRSAMEFFHNAKAVRLRSHHDKYLHAEEDEESVSQDRSGSSKNARWYVELVPGSDTIIRLKSCYGKYLTASNNPFLLGMTGRKVLQTLPRRLDSSVEWEPIRDGTHIKLKTRTATQDWVLWHVDVVEIQVKSSHQKKSEPQPTSHLDSLDFDSSSPSSVSIKSDTFSRRESTESNVSSPPKSEGRTIYYHVADENGNVCDDIVEAYSLNFKGNGVDELTQKLREETGFQDIIVCSRSPLNGKLYPLRLQLPPNNADMHVIVLHSSSKGLVQLILPVSSLMGFE